LIIYEFLKKGVNAIGRMVVGVPLRIFEFGKRKKSIVSRKQAGRRASLLASTSGADQKIKNV
jgi:hypothetical protein